MTHPSRRSRVSLQLRLFAWILTICLTVGGTAGLLIIRSEEKRLVSQALADLELLSARYAETLQEEIDQKTRLGSAANRVVLQTLLQRPYSGEPPVPAAGSDGARRSRTNISGAFLAQDSEPSPWISTLFHQSETLWEELAPVMRQSFFNFYLITPENFIRISPPHWAIEVEAAHDFSRDIFYRLATPENNPGRTPVWTPVYYDSIWQKWMTSLIIPLYDGQRFLGVTGADFILDHLFARILTMGKREGWATGMLFDRQGGLLVHPVYMESILLSRAEMNTPLPPSQIADPALRQLVAGSLDESLPSGRATTLAAGGRTMHLCIQPVPAMAWRLAVYADDAEVTGELALLRWKILASSLLMGLFLALVINTGFHRLVLRRVDRLARTAEKIAGGDLQVPVMIGESDDIGLLEKGFSRMRHAIQEQIVSLQQEIEERELTEKRLKESEERYRALFDATTEAIFIHDGETGRVLDVNQRMLEMFECTKDEALASSADDLSLGEPPYAEAQALEMVLLALTEGPQLFEWHSKSLRGRLFWSEVSLRSVAIGGRKIVLAVVRDVSERKKAEEALQQEQSFVAEILDAQPDTVFVFEPDSGRTLRWNQQSKLVSGYGDEEIRTMTIADFHPPREHERLAEATGELLAEGRINVELAIRAKAGLEIPYEFSGALLRDRTGQPIAACTVGRDLSERKAAEAERANLEQQLRHSQKLEAIGTLAGGIAHDFNNILTAIIGYAELARYQAAPGSSLAEDLDAIFEAGCRARDLVRHILSFSRQAERQRQPVEVAPLIREALKLLRATIPAEIEIRTEISSASCTVLADPSQLHQVLVNLCTNAAHAMEEKGGVLTIGLHRVKVEAQEKPSMDLAPGSYILFSVRDTGCGMDHAVQERIFDPYFTTKEFGKGSGLGLAVVHGIVKAAGGAITVDSWPGTGTTFSVFLPATEEKATTTAETSAGLPRGNEHLLLVDDEPAVVEVSEKVLRSLGYTVTICTNPATALELFREAPDRFQLLVTDQSMPGMNGMELARQLHTLRPGLPVLLCTGYAAGLDEAKARAAGIGAFALKPLLAKDLAQLVRQCLDKGETS